MRKPPGCMLFFYATLTFVSGCFVGGFVGAGVRYPDGAGAIYAPLPHHVPPSPDAAPFRFAMVHDVIHERYPRHGPAFYEERERLAREKMAVLPEDSEAVFALSDDIAVGLARQGRHGDAIALMRDKLRRQEALKLEVKDLYSTSANLAEFLIQRNLRDMLAGDPRARESVVEGRKLAEKSMGLKPTAHFDREQWHLVTVDMLLDFGRLPDLVRKCDLIGNRLDQAIEIPKNQRLTLHSDDNVPMFGRSYDADWTWTIHSEADRREYLEGVRNPKDRAKLRKHVRQVGRESAPAGYQDTERGNRAAFDEPAMWLIGEWRQGSGPNPHYALCLGEIMLRVGQRYLAWTCYERASRLASQFSPTPELRQFLRDHCKQRQDAIERSLPAEDVASLRPKFEAELAFGEAYQRDYQAYTEEKIRAGANLNDEHFFDDFHGGRAPIASRVGPEEWYAGSTAVGQSVARFRAFLEWGLLTGGAGVLLLALIMHWLCRPGTRLTVTAIPPS